MIRGEDIQVLDDMFDSRKTFHIPVYQRNYDWKKEHCEKLLYDIENAVDRNAKEYFIGSFVLVKKEDDKKSFYIIDGQQRITTIVLLLLAILDYAENNNKPLQTSIEKLIFSDVKEHNMHYEEYQITKDVCDILNKAKKDKRRIISVGTTTTRTLESVMTKYNKFVPTHEETNIFIYPGYKFKAIDAQITNFHLPKSTLVMLVSAFASKDIILNAYNCAVKEKYRFFSFGDSMMLGDFNYENKNDN